MTVLYLVVDEGQAAKRNQNGYIINQTQATHAYKLIMVQGKDNDAAATEATTTWRVSNYHQLGTYTRPLDGHGVKITFCDTNALIWKGNVPLCRRQRVRGGVSTYTWTVAPGHTRPIVLHVDTGRVIIPKACLKHMYEDQRPWDVSVVRRFWLFGHARCSLSCNGRSGRKNQG